jgi:hypothetical protein
MSTRALAVMVLIVLYSSLALADFRPDPNPAGQTLMPEGSTKVQMLRETIKLEVQATGSSHLSPDMAVVTGDFVFRNQGKKDEQMQVLFPSASDQSRFYVGRQFRVWLDGKEIGSKEIKKSETNGVMYTWRAFTGRFPVGREVRVQVKYLTDSLNFSFDRQDATPPSSLSDFMYTFATGAAWFDKIGSVDLTVRLPYKVSSENLLANADRVFDQKVSVRYQGNEASWHWNNVEPTSSSYIEVETPATWLWKAILDARERVRVVPQDVAANQTLIRLWAEWYVTRNQQLGDGDADGLLKTCRQAFERLPKEIGLRFLCVKLLPGLYGKHEAGFEGDPVVTAMLKLLGEINQINPYNQDAEEIYAHLDTLGYEASGGTDWSWTTLPANAPRAGSAGANPNLTAEQTITTLAQSAKLRSSDTKGCAGMLTKLKPNPSIEYVFRPEQAYAFTAPDAPANTTKASLEQALNQFGRSWISPLWGTDSWFPINGNDQWEMSIRFFANLDGSRRYAVAVRVNPKQERTVCFLTYLRTKP